MKRLLALALLAASACKGTKGRITDAGGRYDSRSLKFKHGELPSGWVHTKVDGTSLSFDDRGLGATISVFANCKGIEDVSLRALLQQELVGVENTEVISVQEAPIEGREARDEVVRGELDGVTVEMDLVVLRIGGCVYDLVLVGDPRTFDRAQADFRSFVSGFEVLP